MFFHLTWQTIVIFIVFGCAPVMLYHVASTKDLLKQHIAIYLLWAAPIFVGLTNTEDFHAAVILATMVSVWVIVDRGSTALLASSVLSTWLLIGTPCYDLSFMVGILGLEFSSVLTTMIAIYIFYSKRTTRQLTDLLFPLLAYNFVTYIVLVLSIFYYVNIPNDAYDDAHVINSFLVLYALLKFGITPVLLAKTPLYNYLSIDTICALGLPQLLMGLPYLWTVLTAPDLVSPTFLPVLGILTVLFILYTFLSIFDERQFLLISTALFVILLLPLLLSSA